MSAQRYCGYDRLARVYNSHLSHFGMHLLPALQRLVLQRLSPRAWILDVCCGTGQLACVLCERGFQVAGLDGSAEMLRFAGENAPSADFIVADARCFRLPRNFDAAISTHDSMNHMLTLEDLEAAFAHVCSALQPGACFAFDLNMEFVFRTRWNGFLRATQGDEVCEILASWDATTRLGSNHARFSRLDDDRASLEITIQEKCYSEAEVRSALKRAGFVTVTCYDAERDLGIENEFGRFLFVATRS